MTYSFADLRKDVLRDVTTNPEYFGELVTYKADEFTQKINAHCKHSHRFSFDDEGNEIIIEELTVTIDVDDIPREPRQGDLVYRANETIGYLFAYGGGDQPHYWRRVFERRRRLAQG